MSTAMLSDLSAAGRTGVKDWKARVTQKQANAIQLAARGKRLDADEMLAYVLTGDASHLTGQTASDLKLLVKQAKEQMPNESQAKRIWPRKAAAVLLWDEMGR